MKKIVILALISLLLVSGMVLMSCDNNPACSGDGRCSRKAGFLGKGGEYDNCYNFSYSLIVTELDCLPRSASECACK